MMWAEYSKTYRQNHHKEVLERAKEKDRRYREENLELIREKARAKYAEIRELAGESVRPYKKKTPESSKIEPPVKTKGNFGTLEKIIKVTN